MTDVNVSDVQDQADLNQRVKAAAFIGTLQAGYTNFHYLRPIWEETTEKDALIGVGMTGIGSGKVLHLNLTEAAEIAKSENARVAHQIGINIASRVTTVKPSGTSSIVLGCSSGVHAWHAPYYIRRMRLNKVEPLYHYLRDTLPEMIEDSYFNPENEAVLSIPQAAPKGAILRDESAEQLFGRAMKFNMAWVRPGFTEGANDNNVSCTLSLKEEEWEPIGNALWNNRNNYNGMSVIPYDGGSYVQAPFEDISEYMYRKLEGQLHSIDLSKVDEHQDYTDLAGEAACAGGVCIVT
jgi:ribonucleoside-diphosphate reductase alpha chain